MTKSTKEQRQLEEIMRRYQMAQRDAKHAVDDAIKLLTGKKVCLTYSLTEDADGEVVTVQDWMWDVTVEVCIPIIAADGIEYYASLDAVTEIVGTEE